MLDAQLAQVNAHLATLEAIFARLALVGAKVTRRRSRRQVNRHVDSAGGIGPIDSVDEISEPVPPADWDDPEKFEADMADVIIGVISTFSSRCVADLATKLYAHVESVKRATPTKRNGVPMHQ